MGLGAGAGSGRSLRPRAGRPAAVAGARDGDRGGLRAGRTPRPSVAAQTVVQDGWREDRPPRSPAVQGEGGGGDVRGRNVQNGRRTVARSAGDMAGFGRLQPLERPETGIAAAGGEAAQVAPAGPCRWVRDRFTEFVDVPFPGRGRRRGRRPVPDIGRPGARGTPDPGDACAAYAAALGSSAPREAALGSSAPREAALGSRAPQGAAPGARARRWGCGAGPSGRRADRDVGVGVPHGQGGGRCGRNPGEKRIARAVDASVPEDPVAAVTRWGGSARAGIPPRSTGACRRGPGGLSCVEGRGQAPTANSTTWAASAICSCSSTLRAMASRTSSVQGHRPAQIARRSSPDLPITSGVKSRPL